MSRKEDDELFEGTEAQESAGLNEGSKPEDLRILEALLFASDELMTAAHLRAIIPGQPDARKIRSMVEKINMQLQKERHPFEVVEIGGGYQFRTIAFYHPWVRQIFKEKAVKKLSIQSLECLAIIAYKQPISKAEIEAIRGVVSDGAMKTLLEKRLVTISGRSDKPGRPLLYATTQTFLTYFGLNKIEDIPRIEEFEALAREKMDELSIEELAAPDVVPGEEPPESDTDTADEKNDTELLTGVSESVPKGDNAGIQEFEDAANAHENYAEGKIEPSVNENKQDGDETVFELASDKAEDASGLEAEYMEVDITSAENDHAGNQPAVTCPPEATVAFDIDETFEFTEGPAVSEVETGAGAEAVFETGPDEKGTACYSEEDARINEGAQMETRAINPETKKNNNGQRQQAGTESTDTPA